MPHQCPTNDEVKTNHESQMTKDRPQAPFRHLGFVIRLSFVIGWALVGHSSLFVNSLPAQDKKTEPPKVPYAVPLVVKPGEKQKLALRGQRLPAVKEVKVSGADEAKLKVLGAKAVGVPNNYPGDRVGESEVEIELELPKAVKPGAVK